jgi:hypothetical protein
MPAPCTATAGRWALPLWEHRKGGAQGEQRARKANKGGAQGEQGRARKANKGGRARRTRTACKANKGGAQGEQGAMWKGHENEKRNGQ